MVLTYNDLKDIIGDIVSNNEDDLDEIDDLLLYLHENGDDTVMIWWD